MRKNEEGKAEEKKTKKKLELLTRISKMAGVIYFSFGI